MYIPVFFMGLVIKILDDYIDNPKSPIIRYLDRGILPYTLLISLIPLSYNMQLSISILLSAYVIGMFNQLETRYPSGLDGLGEIITITLISLVYLNIHIFFSSIIWMIALQLADDFIDMKEDARFGSFNYWLKFGRMEVGVFFLCNVIIGLYLNIVLGITIFICYFAINFLWDYLSKIIEIRGDYFDI